MSHPTFKGRGKSESLAEGWRSGAVKDKELEHQVATIATASEGKS